MLFQEMAAMSSTFLSPLPYYPFLLPTRSDISERDLSLQTLLHGWVGLGAPPTQHSLNAHSLWIPHSIPALLLLGGERASIRKGRRAVARLIIQPLFTLSLQRDCGESSGPDPQKGQEWGRLRWDWLVKSRARPPGPGHLTKLVPKISRE